MSFTQILLSQIIPDVRKAVPGVKLREAKVYCSDKRNNQWEFHYRFFIRHVTAVDAYEARYNGWTAYLTIIGAEGYKNEDETV